MWVGTLGAQSIRAAAVGLSHAIVQVYMATHLQLGEIDDRFIALRRPDQKTLRVRRGAEQATVTADHVKRHPVTKRRLIETRIRTVEEAQAILAISNAHGRLNRTVYQEVIADATIVAERVVRQLVVEIEYSILKDYRQVERHLSLLSGVPRTSGQIQFVLHGVVQQKTPLESHKYIVSREIEIVVVVPMGSADVIVVRIDVVFKASWLHPLRL